MEKFNQPAQAEIQKRESNGFKNLLMTLATAASLGVTIMPNSAQAEIILLPNATDEGKVHVNGANQQEVEDYLRGKTDEYRIESQFYNNPQGRPQVDVRKNPKPTPGGGTTTNSVVVPNQNTNNSTSNATNTSTQEQKTNVEQGQSLDSKIRSTNTVNPEITNTINPQPITNTNTITPGGTTVVTPPQTTNTATSNPEIKIDNRQRTIIEQPNPLYNLLGTSNLGIGNNYNNFSGQVKLPGCEINESGTIKATEEANGRIGGPEGFIGANASINKYSDSEVAAEIQIGYKFGNEGVKVSRSFAKNVNCIPYNPALQRETVIIYKDNQEQHDNKKEEECECEGDATKENKLGDKPKTLAPLKSRLEKLNPKTLIFDEEHHTTSANLIEKSFESQ